MVEIPPGKCYNENNSKSNLKIGGDESVRTQKEKTPALVGSRIEPDCAYCAFHADGVQKKCLAGQLGGEHCAKFQYDPLRREPKSEQKLGQYSAEEFKL